MKNGIQHKIAIRVGVSDAFISLIINGQKRPSWSVAKDLAVITGTKPELWLEGTVEQIKNALKNLFIK